MQNEPEITSQLVKDHGLTSDEYRRILDLIGRPPNFTELGIFSVMWSEHCSYKSSRPFLKKLPTEGPRVLQGPGENAGVIDIGDGFAVVFKIESHNHPSFIEPHQGSYYIDPHSLGNLEEKGQILFRYCDAKGGISESSNPNGSVGSVAGLCNEQKNVMGMMPHPERCADPLWANIDGQSIFQSLISQS